MLNPATLEGEERLLFRRMEELYDRAQSRQKPQFSYFLSPREQQIALAATRNEGSLFGGFIGAQRQILGIAPQDNGPPMEDFPVTAVEILHHKGEKLSHRTVLGTIMSLGLIRGMTGDILPLDGCCAVVCTNQAAPVLCEELTQIGSAGVRCQLASLQSLMPVVCFLDLKGTVSSPRLDSLVALLTKQSRGRAAELIGSGMVQLDYQQEQRTATPCLEGNTITVGGFGKYIVDRIGAPTRKGRLPVEARKYE